MINEKNSLVDTCPIRLAIIRQRYNPFGGAERFIERALGALLKEGAEVTLITRAWDGKPQDGIRQIICDPKYSRLLGGRVARDRSFAQCALKEMVAGGYDITQSHERIPGCKIFRAGDGVHAAWLDHKARGQSALFRKLSRLSSFHQYILKQEAALLAHPALKKVICISKLVYEEMQRYYNVPEEKLILIENGIDLDDFNPKLSEERVRQRRALGIDEDIPVFLFVGSGFYRKGVPQLLSAMARMQSSHCKLVIVGDDAKVMLFERLAKKLGIADRVIFTGGQENTRPFYGMADAFVLPTLYDPMSNAALEAMACGLPLLASHTCGFSSRVIHGENGFTYDAMDVDFLAECMSEVIKPGRAEIMGKRARESVLDLGLDSMATKMLDLYHGLI